MAANPKVLLAPFLSLGGTDLSDQVKSATVNWAGDTQDATAGNSAGAKANEPGMVGGTLDIEFVDNFDAGQVDATLWALHNTSAAFVYRPDVAAVAVANPQLAGNVIVDKYSLGGAVGATATKSLSLPISGDLARTTN